MARDSDVRGRYNTYTGPTTITEGRLRLGASNVIADNSNIVLNGGTLATGGNSDTVGDLRSLPVLSLTWGTGARS